MQIRQPIHRSWSMRTVPSGVGKVAPTGQTLTHGGFSHCRQGVGMNCDPPPASSVSYTSIHSMGWGTRCPSMHDVVHCGGVPWLWQPSQFLRSMIMVHCRILPDFVLAGSVSEARATGSDPLTTSWTSPFMRGPDAIKGTAPSAPIPRYLRRFLRPAEATSTAVSSGRIGSALGDSDVCVTARSLRAWLSGLSPVVSPGRVSPGTFRVYRTWLPEVDLDPSLVG